MQRSTHVRIHSPVGFVVFLLLAGLTAGPVIAMDVAVPVNMYDYTISGNGNNGDGYYYLDPWSRALQPLEERGYSLVLDSEGEIVWYRSMGLNSAMYSHLRRFENGVVMGSIEVNPPTETHFFNPDGERVDFLPVHHPVRDAERDSHEIMLAEGGGYWTLWLQHRPVDMSQIVPGGDPDAMVGFHIIELWDENHNMLWSWDSFEHQDALPIEDRTEINDLTQSEFEHIHLNAFDILPDGDILASARQMSVVFRIDRETGEVEWRLGGGPLNDFVFHPGNNIPGDMPLEFYAQHDVRYTPDGRFSVFDNGFRHVPPRSYAREYVLNEDSLTAELTWAYGNPDDNSAFITGSFRRLPNGNRLIGWGNMYPTPNATELSPDGNVVWQLEFEPDEELGGWQPGLYRIFKSDEPIVDPQPYLCMVERELPWRDRVYVNWFGHEDEVAAWEIWAGYTPDTPNLLTTRDSGEWILPQWADTDSTVYLRARALDGDGTVISPWSNTWTHREANYTFDLEPVKDHVSPSGGLVRYHINYQFNFPFTLPNVMYWTEATAPDGTTYGPLYQAVFDATGPATGSFNNALQVIPGMAPAGVYEFTAYLGYPGEMVLTDSFLVFKQADGATSVVDESGGSWVASGPGTPIEQPSLMDDGASSRPVRFTLGDPWPNPFNASTRVTVTLPRTTELRLTVHNALGQTVATLHDGALSGGDHTFAVNGATWASGVYLVRAEVPGESTAVRKLMLVK